jgi:drug/metabolite transporter (DMT)-like permease
LGIIGRSILPERVLGDSLIIISSLCWVVGAVLMRKFLKNYSSVTVTTSIFLIGAITFLFPAIQDLIKDPSWPSRISYIGVLGLCYITFFSSVVAFFLFDWGLKEIGIIKTDLFQYVQPLVATALAVLFLGDILHYSLIIGGVLIGLGTYWGTFGKEKHKHPSHHRS